MKVLPGDVPPANTKEQIRSGFDGMVVWSHTKHPSELS
jgi:hypothetical protein